MEWLSDPQAWAALATLTALEIVLGIDNIIFISILVGRLPAQQREKARVLGLALAMLTRLALLMSLVWIMGLNKPLFSLMNTGLSGRDLILIFGGLFLLVKSTSEIHESLEGAAETRKHRAVASFAGVLIQIAIIDIVFSLDSVITAVGLAQQIEVMALAIVISVAVMMFAARTISDFVDAHPTIKMLALAFLILVGTALIAEGFDFHVPRGYIYFAMAFSVAVEMLNLRMRRHATPVKLHKSVARKRRA
jgi:predicted tellurium resistance membrane protein TerC